METNRFALPILAAIFAPALGCDRETDLAHNVAESNTPLEGTLVCSAHEHRLGDDLILDEHRVDFSRLNRQFAQDQDAQTKLNLEAISSCEEADRYAEYRLRREESHPSLGSVADTRLAPPEEPGTDPTAYVMEPTIRGGGNSIVRLSFGGTLCSGTFIHRRVVLTAAHCYAEGRLPAGFIRYGGYDTEVIQNNDVGGYVVNHPDFAHRKDAGSDVALIILDKDVTDRVRAESLWNMKGEVGMQFHFFGWGHTAHEGGLPDKFAGGTEGIDWVGSHHFLDDVARHEARVCKGDSGGPAFTWVNGSVGILGVTSQFGGPGSRYCPYPDAKVRWSSIHGKIQWIESVLSWAGIKETPDGTPSPCRKFLIRPGAERVDCW